MAMATAPVARARARRATARNLGIIGLLAGLDSAAGAAAFGMRRARIHGGDSGDAAYQGQGDHDEGEKFAHSNDSLKIDGSALAAAAIGVRRARIQGGDSGDAGSQSEGEKGEGEKFAHRNHSLQG